MKKITTVLCILLSLALIMTLFAACGKKKNEDVPDPIVIEGDDLIETEPQNETEADETEAEPVNYPTADGQDIKAYDVSFYLPNNLTPNEYNGMLGVYEFYTGEYTGSRPNGLDFSLVVSAESNTNGNLAAYAREDAANAAGTSVEPEEVDLNGFTWLRFTIGADQINYYAVFNNGLYEITARRGGDSQENFDAAKQMLEDTLFFAAAQG